jgi:hypothetical protein
MDAEAHGLAHLAQALGDLVDRVLRLGHRHPVARHDDDALRFLALFYWRRMPPGTSLQVPPYCVTRI